MREVEVTYKTSDLGHEHWITAFCRYNGELVYTYSESHHPYWCRDVICPDQCSLNQLHREVDYHGLQEEGSMKFFLYVKYNNLHNPDGFNQQSLLFEAETKEEALHYARQFAMNIEVDSHRDLRQFYLFNIDNRIEVSCHTWVKEGIENRKKEVDLLTEEQDKKEYERLKRKYG